MSEVIVHLLLSTPSDGTFTHSALCGEDGRLLTTDPRNVTCVKCLRLMIRSIGK